MPCLFILQGLSSTFAQVFSPDVVSETLDLLLVSSGRLKVFCVISTERDLLNKLCLLFYVHHIRALLEF